MESGGDSDLELIRIAAWSVKLDCKLARFLGLQQGAGMCADNARTH